MRVNRNVVENRVTVNKLYFVETIRLVPLSEGCLSLALMGSSLLMSGWSSTGRKMTKRNFLFDIPRLLSYLICPLHNL